MSFGANGPGFSGPTAPYFSTKSAWAASALRDMITGGELRPGQRIVLEDLARRLAVSETPIREALTQLQGEGLVAIEPHRGARVSEVPEKAVDELIKMRLALEVLATREAVQRSAPDGLAALEAIHAESQRAGTAGNDRAFVMANRRFHLALYAPAEMHILSNTIEMLWARLPWGILVTSPGYNEAVIHEHGEVLSALRRGDPERAAALMELHLTGFARRLGDILGHRLREGEPLAPAG